MPEKLAQTLGVTAPLRSIPIVEPEAVHEIGLVAPQREPAPPLVAALIAETKKLAASGALNTNRRLLSFHGFRPLIGASNSGKLSNKQ